MDEVGSPYAVRVCGVERPLLSVVADSAPDEALSVEQLGSRIVGLAGRLAAATCRWLLLVAAFDARDGAAAFGLPSTTRWLGHYCGISARTAREHLRVARTLATHPALAQAMQAGRLSYSHARAISRVAELGDPTLVTNLIMIAEHGTVGQLEDTVRGLRSVDDNHDDDSAAPSPETLSHRWRPDSRWGLSAALDPEHGALVQTAIETLARREQLTHAEALTRMAEIALATLAGSEQPAPSLRGDEHAAIVIHLDASAVPTDPAQDGGSAEPRRPYARLAGGPGLRPGVIERLACSGRIRTITRSPGTIPGQPTAPLDIGANHRLVSDKQFRALLLRDQGCAHPGCGSRIGLEAHHIRHWLWGGKTVLANLVLLCRRHHHAHHDGHFTIRPVGHHRFQFRRADGAIIPTHIDPSTLITSDQPVEDERPHVRPDAATTHWDGSHLDHHYAIATLATNLNPAARRSA